MAKGKASLATLLKEIEASAGDADHDAAKISVADVQAHLGRRSFGPVLAIAALPVATPLVNIPGVSTTMGIIIFLVSLQILAGRNSIWLPEWIRARSVRVQTVKKAFGYSRGAARWIDRLIRPRLVFLTVPPFVQLVALCCAVIGLLMPAIELIPGTSAIPAVPVLAFGLGIMAHDGGLIVFGFAALALMVTGAVFLSLHLL